MHIQTEILFWVIPSIWSICFWRIDKKFETQTKIYVPTAANGDKRVVESEKTNFFVPFWPDLSTRMKSIRFYSECRSFSMH